jgi:hypothetical protein
LIVSTETPSAAAMSVPDPDAMLMLLAQEWDSAVDSWTPCR